MFQGLKPFLFIMITDIFGLVSMVSFLFPNNFLLFLCLIFSFLAFSSDFISCSLKERTLTLTYSHWFLSLLPIDIITVIIMNCFTFFFSFSYFCFSVVREGKANDEDILFIARLNSYYPIWFSSYLSQLPLYLRILSPVSFKGPVSTLLPISLQYHISLLGVLNHNFIPLDHPSMHFQKQVLNDLICW